MDFITGLPKMSKKHDAIMVVVDKLSKVAHFLVFKSTKSASDITQSFIKDIIRLHGMPKKIMSNGDP